MKSEEELQPLRLQTVLRLTTVDGKSWVSLESLQGLLVELECEMHRSHLFSRRDALMIGWVRDSLITNRKDGEHVLELPGEQQ